MERKTCTNRPRDLTVDGDLPAEEPVLTARRPLRVWTTVFEREEGRSAEVGPVLASCGPVVSVSRRSVPAHSHDHYEFAFIIAGTAHHRTELYIAKVKTGTVVFTAPGHLQGFDEIDGLRMITCAFMGEWLFDVTGEAWNGLDIGALFLAINPRSPVLSPWVPQFEFPSREFRRCMAEMADLAEELERETPSLTYARRCLEKLLLLIGRGYTLQTEVELHGLSTPQVRDAVAYIERCITESRPFRVEELAKQAQVSSSYLGRWFRSIVGCSPMDYFQRRRVQRACWLLLNTETPMTEIAHTLGYLDSAHFSRMFRAHQKVSPRAYRALHQERGTASPKPAL